MKRNSFWAVAAFAGAALFTGDLLAQTTPAPQPSICTRACWTASASSGCSSMTSLNRAIIHHTANQNNYNVSTLEQSKAQVRGTQNYHKNSNGWCDIGYHFLVDKLGNIFEGRYGSMGGSGSWRRGAHDGCNSSSFGFSCLGYFHSPYNNSPVAAMRNALYDVIAWRMPGGWSPYGSGTYCSKTVGWLGSHRNVSATACPGDLLFGYIGNNWSGGEARTSVAARRTPAVNNAAVVSMSYPSSVAVGQVFSASVTMNNNGTTTWTTDSTPHRLGSQNPQDNNRWGLGRVGLPHNVSPGQNVTFNFTCTAPGSTGTYPFDWRMVEELVQWFGATAVGSISVTSGCTQTATVDNNQAGFTTSGNWSTGTSATDKLGADYRFRSTAAVSDPAKWTATLNCTGAHVVQAWWPQGWNRSQSAPYIIQRDGGTSTVHVNQQTAGGQWNTLGSFNITAGSRYVQLSCWTTTGYVVIADGVRWVKN